MLSDTQRTRKRATTGRRVETKICIIVARRRLPPPGRPPPRRRLLRARRRGWPPGRASRITKVKYAVGVSSSAKRVRTTAYRRRTVRTQPRARTPRDMQHNTPHRYRIAPTRAGHCAAPLAPHRHERRERRVRHVRDTDAARRLSYDRLADVTLIMHIFSLLHEQYKCIVYYNADQIVASSINCYIT